MNGGLLTILGRAGEGFFGANTENIKRGIKNRKEKALALRKENLEKIKHGYLQQNIRLQDQLAGERSKESDIRTGERSKEFDIRKEEAAVKAHERKEEASTDLEKKYKFIVEVLGKEEAKSLIRASVKGTGKGTGKGTENAKLKVDTLIKACEMKDSGYSLEEINAVLSAAGLPNWVKKKTTQTEKGWLWDTEKEVDTFGPAPAGLLGGTSDDKTIATNTFDEIMGKINPKEKTNLPEKEPEPGGLLQKPSGTTGTWEEKSRGKSLTDPADKIVDVEDMKKKAAFVAKGIDKVHDVAKAVEKTALEQGWNLTKKGFDLIVRLGKEMVESQSKARDETFN